ncbi:MAG: protocatechuate 3,4-dioxygenase [Polyangiales bacterium]
MGERLSRRVVLLAPLGIAASHWLSACSEDPTVPSDERDAAPGEAPRDAGVDARTTPRQDAQAPVQDAEVVAPEDAEVPDVEDAGAPLDAAQDARVEVDANLANVPWASGGTSAMAGNYPDPFAGGPGSVCALYPAQTLGPCYASPVQTREDISDGVIGVPVRMSFLVVDSDGCTPVANAEVDVWSAGSNGVYSAFASGTCNPDRLDVARLNYCRGKRNTDANGRVDFSTVFPGWYRGRTIHIHFTVRANGREFITSQLYFDDALSDELLKQKDYASRGARDTTNRTDSILRGGNAAPVLFETAKRADGALHAWKTLSVRA